jgi:hypothetical protein
MNVDPLQIQSSISACLIKWVKYYPMAKHIMDQFHSFYVKTTGTEETVLVHNVFVLLFILLPSYKE